MRHLYSDLAAMPLYNSADIDHSSFLLSAHREVADLQRYLTLHSSRQAVALNTDDLLAELRPELARLAESQHSAYIVADGHGTILWVCVEGHQHY